MLKGKTRQLLSRYFPLIMVAVLSAIVGGAITAHLVIGSSSVAENAPAQSAPVPTSPVGDSMQAAVRGTTAVIPTGNLNVVADIAEEVAPAVVKIQTKIPVSSVRGRFDPFFSDPFFRYFFGDPFGDSQPNQQYEQGTGSGFVIDRDGYILTNDHVVHGAAEIKVYVKGHADPYTAKVVGGDERLDLAVIKIDPKGKTLPTVTLGDADKTRVGEWVIAIGDPYGMDWTVTTGVLSAKGRPLTIYDEGQPRRFGNLLQTDAAINPGNSGGPLIDLNGDVIGINTAVNTQAQGLGFAIPVDKDTKDYIQQLKSGKPVTLKEGDKLVASGQPWLGVKMMDLTPDLAEQLNLKRGTEGVLISEVVYGSPADKAGLQPGDVVVGFKNAKVTSSQQLADLVSKTKVGEKVAVTVYREGRRLVIVAIIGSRPEDM